MMKFLIRVLPSALLVLTFGLQAEAQKRSARKPAPAATQDASAEKATSPEQFRQDFIKAAEEYKASLQALVVSYEGSVKALDEKHAKLQELFRDGIISKREMDASEQVVAETRAKVEGARKELAAAETTLEAAKKPLPAVDAYAADSTVAGVRPNWTTGNSRIDALIRLNGSRYGVDPYLIYCVMHQESRFGSGATSYKGAMGLMQLMPGTAARYGVTNAYDPAQSIMGGTRYLKDLLRLFGGRVDLALAGYNAGEGAVMKYGYRVPPYRETQNYVQIIGSRYTKNTGVSLTARTRQAAPAPAATKAKSK
jgi:soluble lytic murein transglycosylase-like protein